MSQELKSLQIKLISTSSIFFGISSAFLSALYIIEALWAKNREMILESLGDALAFFFIAVAFLFFYSITEIFESESSQDNENP